MCWIRGNSFGELMPTVKILIIPCSLRTGSLNARLAAVIAKEFALANVDVTRLSLVDYPLPIYDGDLEVKSGVPKSAVNLERMMSTHHGIVFVTPEYNSSLPPLLTYAVFDQRVGDRAGPGPKFDDRPFGIDIDILRHGAGEHLARRHHRAHVQRLFNP